MHSEGILLKAKIYIVLVQNLRNNKRERSGHLCLGKIFSPTSPNWKTSFEKNCFSAWASTLNMGLINKIDMVCLSPVGYGV